MTLPRLDEYQLAVQNPKNSFKDPELQRCRVKTTPLGLPAVTTGGFALIYHLYQKEDWAVRCFHRELGDLQSRYDVISRFLAQNANGTFVKASLQIDGIRVGGNNYPILVMPWLQGDVLNYYIERNLQKPSEISWLPESFLKLVNYLEKLGVAHGDLQHGNIMVRNKDLTLIDYDGIYLPELVKSPSTVLGHVNYLHPDRSGFRPSLLMDRFPSIVVYLGLLGVAAEPSLWRKYSNGENILFQKGDFEDPSSSPLLKDLKLIQTLAPLVDKFQDVCLAGYEKTPSLAEFISPTYRPPKPIARIRPTPTTVAKPIEYITQYEVVLAERTDTIMSHVGGKVEVVGQVTDIYKGATKRHQSYMFLNFGDWRKKAFYLVLWADALDLFRTSGIEPSSFVHKWVSITGMITEYNDRPQMIVEMPSQIQRLSSKEEALRRASHAPRTAVVIPARPKQQRASYQPRPISYPPDVIRRQQADTLQRLYSTTPSGPAATPSQLQPSAPRTGKPVFATPRLAWAGISITMLAIGLLVAMNALWIPMLILGSALAYLGTLYRSFSVPISIQSLPFQPRYTGACRKCGQKFGPGFYTSNLGLYVVKTERGYMHDNCARQAKRRVWRRVNQIGLSKLWPVARPIAVPRSKKRYANLLSLGIVCVSLLSLLVMSYPSIPYVSTAINTSASFLTQTSFVTTTTTYHSYVVSSISSTTCSYRQDNEVCKTLSSIGTFTSSGTYTSTQNQGAYVQAIITSITNSFSLLRAPYVVLGISSFNWMFTIGIIVLIATVAAVLVRRR